MNHSLFQSLNDIKPAFKNQDYDPETIMMGSISFLRRAVERRDEAVKQFLLDLAKKPATTLEERFARARAISWLGHYKDPHLLPLFVRLLSVTRGICQHETILSLVELDDPRAAGAIAELLEQETKPREIEFLLGALCSVRAPEYLDLIATYLPSQNLVIRIAAITSLLALGATTGRKEVLEIAIPFLEDPDQTVRIKTAYHINMQFPNEFYDRGLEHHLPEGLRFPRRPQQDQQPPEAAQSATPAMALA
ncbi:MAG: HEAT repeat domain-containing protein [Ardenticatenaceae bacterium]